MEVLVVQRKKWISELLVQNNGPPAVGHDVARHNSERHDGTKANGGTLDRNRYTQLAQPTVREPISKYGTVAPDLYQAILNRCVAPGTVCMNQMMMTDAGATAKHLAKGQE